MCANAITVISHQMIVVCFRSFKKKSNPKLAVNT